MARIRTIKPDFWRHEAMSGLPEATRLLALGLLTYADDEGYFNANPKLIQAELSPLIEPSVSIHDSLTHLSAIDYIQIADGPDGRQYGRIVNFTKHQRINRPSTSKIKGLNIAWPPFSGSHDKLTEDSMSRQRAIITPSPQLADRNREQGTGNKERNGDDGALTAEAAFDRFFGAYPLQVGRPEAKKAFEEALAHAPALDIIEAAKRYAQANATTPKRYVKHPANWLRKRCWEDGAGQTTAVIVDPSWGQHAERLAAAIGQDQFRSWFASEQLCLGPPTSIIVRLNLSAQEIPRRFSGALSSLFGGDVQIVLAPREAAA